MKIMVTGGAGFIGSNLVRYFLRNNEHSVLTLDKLTYAGRLENLAEVINNKCHFFEKVDIIHFENVRKIIENFKPDLIFHLAAESHVDRSIDSANNFVQTNIVGTSTLLEATYLYWKNLNIQDKDKFRFIHVSTDEVFGSLETGEYFNETSSYRPNSPYAATKASSDLLVRSYNKTFGFPAIIVNCSNNYGPYQYPEKLIPLCILNAIEGKDLPIYGDGLQVRDWLYVDDHVRALEIISTNGIPGETYCVGGNSERQNTEVVSNICNILDELNPMTDWGSHHNLIKFVKDRPGHDQRYAIDSSKLKKQLGWSPSVTFSDGIKKTVNWYLSNRDWWNPLRMPVGARVRYGLQEVLIEKECHI